MDVASTAICIRHCKGQHFQWDGYVLAAKTPLGRATASALNLNHPRRILIRQAEKLFDLFPG
jgi:hypothetical protein